MSKAPKYLSVFNFSYEFLHYSLYRFNIIIKNTKINNWTSLVKLTEIGMVWKRGEMPSE